MLAAMSTLCCFHRYETRYIPKITIHRLEYNNSTPFHYINISSNGSYFFLLDLEKTMFQQLQPKIIDSIGFSTFISLHLYL